MKRLDEMDLPALRALAKREFLHQIGAKSPDSRRKAAERRHEVLVQMKKFVVTEVVATS